MFGSGNAREWFSSGRGATLLAVFAALLVLAVTALMIAAHAAGGAPAKAAPDTGRDTLRHISTYDAPAGGESAGAVESRKPPSRGAVGPGTSTGVDGVMVVPGYHRHFVSDDRRTAGHVLDVDVSAAPAGADHTTKPRPTQPGSSVFAATPF